VKPDAVRRGLVGAVIGRFESIGLHVIASRHCLLTKEQAAAFYVVHKDLPFYEDLAVFMSSGLVIVNVLKGENAILGCRSVIGAPDPLKAATGTIRAEFAISLMENSVHASDSYDSTIREIAFFFPASDPLIR